MLRASALLLCLGAGGCAGDNSQSDVASVEEWVSLFNGVDLTGWTPKIRGLEVGQDPHATFRVEDGLLTVQYDGDADFDGQFGHLFFERPFESFHLQVEYRFVGEQARGGPEWAFRNSGVMFHAQSPQSMRLNQDFPVSLEAQFLGAPQLVDGAGDSEAETALDLHRPTGSLCTPGTDVEQDGQRRTQHCLTADGPTFFGDQWVRFDLIVRGDSIVHVIGGDTVMAYQNPRVGGGNVEDADPEVKIDGTPLTRGYVALQSESHPVQFRTVRIREFASIPPPA